MEAMPEFHQLPLLMAGDDMINAAAAATIKHGVADAQGQPQLLC